MKGKCSCCGFQEKTRLFYTPELFKKTFKLGDILKGHPVYEFIRITGIGNQKILFLPDGWTGNKERIADITCYPWEKEV